MRTVAHGLFIIGLVAMLAARALGISRIVIVDVEDSRLSVAKKLGADDIIKVSTNIQAKTLMWANMPGSSSVLLLTPFEALSSVRFSFRMSRSASRVYKPFSFQCSLFESSVWAFSLLIRAGVAVIEDIQYDFDFGLMEVLHIMFMDA
ncbi:Alcohol dehydrogenase, C-terminal [Artemisia annua]|uniref:Alcohol dehydrogenase, C-terminal n=1 Tax=Artemisia annua TaxID=35608 RepID=A0A2U1M794_ARTAN|nr:Alcohol dehydrogenase, C-terminal [Artemisia annua]